MSKKQKQETDLALVPENESALMIPGQTANVELPEGIELQDADLVPQVEEEPVFPYLSIRQKDHADSDDTEIEWKKGWWKSSMKSDDIEKLKITVLFWNKARTYFREGDEKPYCKSINGENGSLITSDTNQGNCPSCPYGQWQAGDNGKQKKPVCSEGRNIYAMVEGIGPAVIRLGVSSIAPWKAFDNLMKNQAVVHNGQTHRLPWIFHIVELKTEVVKRSGFDPYFVVAPVNLGLNKDKETLNVLRSLMKEKDKYDETATQTDLGTEDINGKKPSSDDNEPMDWEQTPEAKV